jgi:3,4-dihydroxy 2-butanone 4-phosphate synthase/GTP cyclohydrolase II
LHVLVQEPPRISASDNPPSAFIMGSPSDGCLVRIHSRCLYGEVIGSRECDCGLQLTHALAMMRSAGAGVLIYLDQEGRGAGLFPKARAHRRHEDQGIDSFTSYELDGLQADMRTYDDAIAILQELGLQCVTLLTNNWEKVAALRDAGIKVEPRSLVVPFAPEAEPYMRSKHARGHDLDEVFGRTESNGECMQATPSTLPHDAAGHQRPALSSEQASRSTMPPTRPPWRPAS